MSVSVEVLLLESESECSTLAIDDGKGANTVHCNDPAEERGGGGREEHCSFKKTSETSILVSEVFLKSLDRRKQ